MNFNLKLGWAGSLPFCIPVIAVSAYLCVWIESENCTTQFNLYSGWSTLKFWILRDGQAEKNRHREELRDK